MIESTSYLRGAFIAYESGGYPDKKRVIPFRFNPESLSRSLSVEQGQSVGDQFGRFHGHRRFGGGGHHASAQSTPDGGPRSRRGSRTVICMSA